MKVLTGPKGAKLVFEEGSPVTVEWQGASATIYVALDSGELSKPRSADVPLPPVIINWLEQKLDEAEEHQNTLNAKLKEKTMNKIQKAKKLIAEAKSLLTAALPPKAKLENIVRKVYGNILSSESSLRPDRIKGGVSISVIGPEYEDDDFARFISIHLYFTDEASMKHDLLRSLTKKACAEIEKAFPDVTATGGLYGKSGKKNPKVVEIHVNQRSE